MKLSPRNFLDIGHEREREIFDDVMEFSKHPMTDKTVKDFVSSKNYDFFDMAAFNFFLGSRTNGIVVENVISSKTKMILEQCEVLIDSVYRMQKEMGDSVMAARASNMPPPTKMFNHFHMHEIAAASERLDYLLGLSEDGGPESEENLHDA